MSSIEVTARIDARGVIYPTRFVWNGRTYLVDSVGRRWQKGMSEHILVRVATGKVYELIYAREAASWYLKLIPDLSIKKI